MRTASSLQTYTKKNFLPALLSIICYALLAISPVQAASIETCAPVLSLNPTTLAVVGAAAVDSINPCALAILILLMASMLLAEEEPGTEQSESKKRRRTLLTGLSFILAIFLAYFLIGFSIFNLIRNCTLPYSGYFYKIVGSIAIIIGLFNLKDYFWYGKGFLMEVPLSWRPKMKSLIRRIASPAGAFIIGLLVSLFLLPCTSGPYIVIIGMLAAKKIATIKAVSYLVLHNIVFVLPMLAMVFIIHFGLSVEKAEEWRKQKLRLLHLVAGVILIGLGIAILFRII